ncbi:hypothetical protein H4219_005646 [Mycoemilia scoparia]|uniref:Uncharacterized protein n=1 Tax=Mycoemilia scoparia TaxID=417184 RepID=A0A9W7ZM34_9FUNG|nr:hypothetical protein H4219_005646 [Mycoemilia scoparia]
MGCCFSREETDSDVLADEHTRLINSSNNNNNNNTNSQYNIHTETSSQAEIDEQDKLLGDLERQIQKTYDFVEHVQERTAQKFISKALPPEELIYLAQDGGINEQLIPTLNAFNSQFKRPIDLSTGTKYTSTNEMLIKQFSNPHIPQKDIQELEGFAEKIMQAYHHGFQIAPPPNILRNLDIGALYSENEEEVYDDQAFISDYDQNDDDFISEHDDALNATSDGYHQVPGPLPLDENGSIPLEDLSNDHHHHHHI